MKTARIIGSFMIGMMAFSNSIYSQQDSTKGKVEFIVKADLFLPILLTSSEYYINNEHFESLTIEACFHNRQSVQLTGLLYTEPGYHHLEIIPEYKYFLCKKHPYTGFYVGPYFKLINNGNSITHNPDVLNYHEFYDGVGEGVILGYQRYLLNHLAIDLLIGFGDAQIFYIRENTPYDYLKRFSYLDGRLAINIGYKF